MQQSVAAETAERHEGIAYLLGQTNGSTTIVLGAVRPESHTTRGSFNVSSLAMAKVVRKANDAGLQVVGQIHTHPGEAYHSDGDVEGARIAYEGFVSIVAPDYGRLLPSLARCAVYFFQEGAFVMLRSGAITVTSGRFWAMTGPSWYRLRNDRTIRYAGRALSPDRPILLKLNTDYGSRYDGQVAVIVAANLLARMTPSVAFSVPDIEIVEPLPWAGMKLHDLLMTSSFAADPGGRFSLRGINDGDYVLSLGREFSPATVHGSGWNAFVGPDASPVPDSPQPNPVGAALAVIVAVARLFALHMQPMDGPHLFNAFDWRGAIVPDNAAPAFDRDAHHGAIWTVGLGSVGTAALYFFSLATRRFLPILFDMKGVEIHNLDRSPIFTASDAEAQISKVDATKTYLESIGIKDVQCEPIPLDQSKVWAMRQAGTPDLVIAAANERDVRYIIEQSAPPLQIYGTTGANWQACVIRHIPMAEACSCCLFPPHDPKSVMTCAASTAIQPSTGKPIDASLPFLSFAAGLMAAAEILKTQMPGYPFTPNRTTLYTHPEAPPRLVSLPISRRPECLCASRSSSVHASMISGTRHWHLSAPEIAAKSPAVQRIA